MWNKKPAKAGLPKVSKAMGPGQILDSAKIQKKLNIQTKNLKKS